MQLTSSQQASLTAMGIPLWQRRASQQVLEISSVSAAEHTSPLSIELFPVQYLIVVPRQTTATEQALLSAILKACAISQDNYQLILSTQWHSQLEWPVQMTHVIQFSGDPHPDQLASPAESMKLIDCPGLAEMLVSPALKAQCWSSLKSLSMV